MKIAICTLTIGSEYKKIVHFGTQSKIKYCSKHGYNLYMDEDIYDQSRPIAWSKIKLLQKYIHNYDYIIWIDADTMIINNDIKIETFIDKYMQNKDMQNKDMLLAYDSGNLINTGVWFLKNTQYVYDFLTDIYDQTHLIHDRFWEQSSFNELYHKNHKDIQNKSIILCGEESLNINATIYNYKLGKWLIHFLGIHTPEWLTQVMSDHYLYKREGETDNDCNNRIQWFFNRYKI